MGKKQVIIFMESLNAGGAEKVLSDLLKGLDYSLFNITLLLFYKEGVYLNDIPKNVNVLGLFTSRNILSRLFFKLSRNGYDLPLKYLLKSKLNDQYQLTVSFMEGIPLKMQELYNPKVPGISWVHTDLLADHWTSSFFLPGVESMIYSKSKQILFVSRVSLDNFKKVFPEINTLMSPFYNPIDREAIQKNIDIQKYDGQLFRIVSVGRLTVQKSYDRLIEAINILKSKGLQVHLNIVGDGPLKNNLQLLVNELNLNNEITFCGYVKTPYTIVANSDLFVSSSYVEGYSLVICEALCLGIPVLSTETAGALEILEGGYGYIVDHTSIALADGIEKLINNPSLLKHYKLKAKEKSLYFDINKTVREFEGLLLKKYE
ncbi:MAG: glycosyltransferase [Bacteroidales bacterium]